MTFLDYILLVLLIIYFLTGLRKGLFVSLGTLGGFILGAVAAFYVTPWVVTQVSAGWYVVAALFSVMLCVLTGQWIGFLIGRTLRRLFDTTPLRRVERVAGGVLNIFVCALAIVVVTLLLRPLGIPQLSAAMSESAVISTIMKNTPESVQSSINNVRAQVMSSGAIPEVTDLLYPSESAPTEEINNSALETASQSVVQILGAAEACNYTSEGSGFVTEPGYVVTNAHVVAGVTEPVVQDRQGQSYTGTVVYYDNTEDLAIIHAPQMQLAALPIGPDVAAGTTVSFMGYPKGGPFQNRSAIVQGLGYTHTVNSETGDSNASRLVYQLAAQVEQGNSGGPVIDEDGHVIGVIFAKATTGQTGYAIPASVLRDAVSGIGTYTEVGTGACATR